MNLKEIGIFLLMNLGEMALILFIVLLVKKDLHEKKFSKDTWRERST